MAFATSDGRLNELQRAIGESSTSVQAYPRGVELFHQGGLLDEVFYITRGIVKLVSIECDGRESILALAFSGQWLGTAPVLARQPSPVSALTCCNTLVKRMTSRTFRRLLQEDSESSLKVHQAHSMEVCRLLRWIGQLNSASSHQRLRRVIREFIAALCVPDSGKAVRFVMPLQRWELARLLAVTPEHLSRMLKELQEQCLIRREKGWMVVPDVQRLCPDSEREDALWFPIAARADLNAHNAGGPFEH